MQTKKIVASDIKTHSLVTTSPETHVLDAIERLIAHHISGLPVVNRHGEFLGRFSERAAMEALDLGQPNSAESDGQLNRIKAGEIMNRWTPVLRSHQEVFECVNTLIERKVSGAPVVGNEGELCGVFSEQSAMRVFVGLCWDQLPSSKVTAWLDQNVDRRICESTPLSEILDRFCHTPFRRLMVLQEGRLVGQISRQDALRAALQATREPLVASRTICDDRQNAGKTRVEDWMRDAAAHVEDSSDVLRIAQQFLNHSARQLPVLDESRITGQISRCDLLRAIQHFFPDASQREVPSPLYLSSVEKRRPFATV